jgi:hypothetical protein
VLAVLLANFEQLKVQYAEFRKDTPFWVAIEQAWAKATEYYSLLDRTPAYTAAVLVDPRLKDEYLKQERGLEWAKVSVQNVRKLWEEDYKERKGVARTPHIHEVLQGVDGNKQRPHKRRNYTSFDEHLEEHRTLTLPQKAEDELTVYLNDRLETDCSLVPFQFWLRPEVHSTYPTLSLLAIDILSIPAMSAGVERVLAR